MKFRMSVLGTMGTLMVAAAILRVTVSSGSFALADVPTGSLYCSDLEDTEAVMALLEERSNQLDGQEQALRAQDEALNAKRVEIEAKIKELEEAQASLEQTISIADTAAENDLTRLTNIYESMKPRDAATLFAAMAPEFSAGFIARMRPEFAAEVIAGMDPETAYTISVLVAGRNAGAGGE